MNSVPFKSAGFVQLSGRLRRVSDSYYPIRVKREHLRDFRMDIGFHVAKQLQAVAQWIIEEKDSDYCFKQQEIMIILLFQRKVRDCMTVILNLQTEVKNVS